MPDTMCITNLLYRYAELMDGGDLDGAAALFHHARIRTRGSEALIDWQQLRAIWASHVIIYPCGTPRTRHVVSNPIIELDDSGARASVRSCYTVYQAAPDFPLQIIAGGRYHDEMERVEGVWRFCFRDYSLLDLIGDLSTHLKMLPAG